MDLAVDKFKFDWNYLKDILDEKAVMLHDLSITATDGCKLSIPILLFHHTGIYAFVKTPVMDLNSLSNYLAKTHLELKKTALIAPSCILVYGIIDSNSDTKEPYHEKNKLLENLDSMTYIYDSYTGLRPTDTGLFIDTVLSEFDNRNNCFTEGDITRLSEVFKTFKKPDSKGFNNTLQEIDGVLYIRKRGVLHEASDLNSEINFYLALLGGVIGLHKFYQHKWLKGLAYLLTCGFCGVAWVLDIFEILIGIAKDCEGYYLMPVKKRKFKLLLSVFWLIPVCFIVKTYLYFVTVYPLNFLKFNSELPELLQNMFALNIFFLV